VAGIAWRYLRCGQDTGSLRPPVLLIHGLLGYSFSWRFNLAPLAEHGMVYAPDLPGAGFSARPPHMDRSLGGYAANILRFMNALRLDTVDIIATSHGGAVAMKLAALAPQRVRRLVLAAPVNPWSETARWQLRLARGWRGWLTRRLLRHFLPLNGFFLKRVYGDPQRIAPGTSAAYTAPLRLPGTADHLADVLRTWQSDIADLARDLGPAASLGRIPTLLIWGSLDPAVSPASAQPLRRAFQNADLVMLEGVGHLPYEEVPELFNRAVNDFLAS
jgi:pimeloyl-ACP methyl ester carboxylesterase